MCQRLTNLVEDIEAEDEELTELKRMEK